MDSKAHLKKIQARQKAMFSDSDSDEAPTIKDTPNIDGLDFTKISTKAASQQDSTAFNNQ